MQGRRTGEDLKALLSGINRSGQATLAIKSAHFGTYLRMDGRGPIQEEGGGKVQSHAYVGLWELFRIVPQSDGSVGIQSTQFDTWLRMDARGAPCAVECGGGTVNCQTFVGSMERFIIRAQEDGTVAFQSAQFGTYLRMESLGVAQKPSGGGVVNCSKDVRSWERFLLDVVRPVIGIKSFMHNLFLRIDCHVNKYDDDDISSNDVSKGKVRTEKYFGEWEKFEIDLQEDGAVAIKSVAFSCYLSAENIKVGTSSTVGSKEKFFISHMNDGLVAFKSHANAEMQLSMSTSGEISMKSTLGNTEKFEIIMDC